MTEPKTLSGRVALVTGGSRGVGAAAVVALARAGADVIVNYRNKRRRGDEVAASARAIGSRALAVGADIVDPSAVDAMLSQVAAEFGRIDVLVLNASGGMERDLAAADPDYPMRVNRDAPLYLLERALPLLSSGAVVIHVTSHLAHYYGRVEQLPAYEPVARSKHAGERALIAMQPRLSERRIRLAIVSGDLIADTIVPRLMDRNDPGLIERRRSEVGTLPTTIDMADAIVRAASDDTLSAGAVLYVGSTSLPPLVERAG